MKNCCSCEHCFIDRSVNNIECNCPDITENELQKHFTEDQPDCPCWKGQKQEDEKFKCIKTYASEPEQYGIDFYEGKEYTGEKEDNEYYYLNSTENGTCVLISNKELTEYFVKIN